MNINPVSSRILGRVAESESVSKVNETTSDNFSNILSEALETAAETDKSDKVSALELLSGQSDDFSGLMLDAQKAEIALNLAIQLRNKVLDAYKEIMNMSI